MNQRKNSWTLPKWRRKLESNIKTEMFWWLMQKNQTLKNIIKKQIHLLKACRWSCAILYYFYKIFYVILSVWLVIEKFIHTNHLAILIFLDRYWLWCLEKNEKYYVCMFKFKIIFIIGSTYVTNNCNHAFTLGDISISFSHTYFYTCHVFL